jgi:hypothetical protein
MPLVVSHKRKAHGQYCSMMTRTDRIATIFGLCAFCLNTYLLQDATIVNAFLSTSSSRSRNLKQHGILSSTNNGGGDGFGELTSALTILDDQWQIQQRSPTAGKPRWKKLFLPEEEDDENKNDEDQQTLSNNDFVWMLEPPNQSIPSCIIVFTGGAGLGAFPQVVYNELLSKISIKLNAVCITAPYEVGLDHFTLAKQTGELIRRSLLYLNDNDNDGDDKSSSGDTASDSIIRSRLPTFSLAHSLGCKLQTIYMAATGIENSFDGIGFMAYNNFSFAKTITMARSFAQELKKATSSGGMGGIPNIPNIPNMNMNDDMINSIFDFAEMAVGAIGVDFSPNAQDTERLIQLRYNDIIQTKTRLFVFDDDNLDSSQEFISACNSNGNDSDSSGEGTSSSNNNNNNLSISNLPGGHLTPVYFQLNANDLGDNFPPENIDMAKEAMGGFQGASFGDEETFLETVDEICDWVLGKAPTFRGSGALPESISSSSQQ